MMIKTEIFCGGQMRKARILHNIKLEELAQETKIDKKKLFEFERGIILPTQEEEAIIAKTLLIKPNFFYQTDTAPLTEDCINFSPRMRRL